MAKEIKSDYKVIGVMAGSSMDGLDVAEVSFSKQEQWTFQVGRHETVPYDPEVETLLKSAIGKELMDQKRIDEQFGEWIGDKLLSFGVDDCDLIAVHGHTLIHKPDNGISWQLGRGDVIAEKTGVKVVTEFRSLDVQMGGQGAPLVPIGDFELFAEYDACLNLGGIANISIRKKQMAWDICPCNQVLNAFAEKLGYAYDEDGELAQSGNLMDDWVEKIATIPFFSEKPPKSLPNNFISQDLLDQIEPMNGLHSYVTFLSGQIVNELKDWLPFGSQVLVSGGGAHNTYLIDLLNNNSDGITFHIPERTIVEFKEAIIFGYLGLLKLRNETNVLASVTGASRDSCSGVIHYPK